MTDDLKRESTPFDEIARKHCPEIALSKALAMGIANQESRKCKTLDEALYHQSKWERILPEATELLERIIPLFVEESARLAQAASEATIEHYVACNHCAAEGCWCHDRGDEIFCLNCQSDILRRMGEVEMKTPILDKYNLHPCGGYCTCFSSPSSSCSTCEAIKNLQARWAALDAKTKKIADKEYDEEYPRTSNQDGR